VTSVYTTTPLADRAEAVQNAIEHVEGVSAHLKPRITTSWSFTRYDNGRDIASERAEATVAETPGHPPLSIIRGSPRRPARAHRP
jgi:hypothetical protein